MIASRVVRARGLDLEPSHDSSGNIRVSGRQGEGPPVLTFACDGSTTDLEHMFSQPAVISDLKNLKAGISLALPDLSAERVRLVLKLNEASIPVTAWLAVPPDQGYYLNARNAQEATARFADFQNWSTAYGLRWAGVGLDIEPNIQEFAALKQGGKWRVVMTLLERYFDVSSPSRARKSYALLIRRIHAQGYRVETYQFPFIADERTVHSTLLERLAGIVDVRGDRECLMLYTSFNPALDSALIWVYGPDAQAIVVGSISGSDSDPHFVPLNWEEFSRDLIVAHHFSQVLGVYSLEGCVRKGFLHRLRTINWDHSIVIPAESARKAMRFRTRVQRAIWIASQLPYFAVVMLIVIAWVIARWRKRRRVSRPLRPRKNGNLERLQKQSRAHQP